MILIKGGCKSLVFWTTETITQKPEVLHIFMKFCMTGNFLVFWNKPLPAEKKVMKHILAQKLPTVQVRTSKNAMAFE